MRSENTGKTCKVCGHALRAGMKICDQCGSIQRGTRIADDMAGESRQPRTFPCKFCGVSTNSEHKVCDSCTALEERIASGYYGPDVPLPEQRRGFAAAVKAFFMAVAGFFRRLFTSKKRDRGKS